LAVSAKISKLIFTHELTEGFSERFFFVPPSPDYLKLLHTSYGRDGSLGGIRCFQLFVLFVKPKKSFFRIIWDFGHVPNDRLPRRTGLEG
jgi:hypothetical protein